MKITAFNPIIVTSDAAATIELFEALGFEQAHNKAENKDVAFSSHRMKNEGGFHVDVTEVPAVKQTYTAIRINVDDFDEAYDFFMSKGFREAKGFPPSTTESSKYAYLVSPSGFIVDVIKHVKKQ
jgi:catechol 2,3-dioxygenase-like lactoylglutathione lyase family enzyme